MNTLFLQLQETSPEILTLPGPSGKDGALLWLSMFIIVPIGALMGPHLWTRMYAAKNGHIFNLIPLLLGIISIIHVFPMLTGYAGIILEPRIENPDSILPMLLYRHVPYVFMSLVMVGGAAAAMSTSNSQIHSISSVYTIDIHQKHINKKMSNKKLLLTGRISIVVFSAISYVTLILVPGLLIDIGLLAMSGTAQLIIPLIGALLWRRSTSQGAIAGLISGMVVLTTIILLGRMNMSIEMAYAGMAALFINAVVFYFVSKVTPGRDEKRLQLLHEQLQEYQELT